VENHWVVEIHRETDHQEEQAELALVRRFPKRTAIAASIWAFSDLELSPADRKTASLTAIEIKYLVI